MIRRADSGATFLFLHDPSISLEYGSRQASYRVRVCRMSGRKGLSHVSTIGVMVQVVLMWC